MIALTKSICWRTVVRSRDINKIGVVIYQKPTSNSCYLMRKNNEPPLCSESDGSRSPWYIFLLPFFLFRAHCLLMIYTGVYEHFAWAWMHLWPRHTICTILGRGYWCITFRGNMIWFLLVPYILSHILPFRYTPLDSCLFPTVSSSGGGNTWPISWPERLNMKHSTTSKNTSIQFSQEKIDSEANNWKDLVSEVYLNEFAVNWSSVRNVMDMNAGFGG